MQAPETQDSITGINVTPLVDIILVLLIIFMATAPLMSRRALNVSIPKAQKSERIATETLRLELTKERTIFMDGKRLKLPDLIRELKILTAREPALHVAVAADQAVPYGEVVRLLDDIRLSGVKRVGLEVKSK